MMRVEVAFAVALTLASLAAFAFGVGCWATGWVLWIVAGLAWARGVWLWLQ